MIVRLTAFRLLCLIALTVCTAMLVDHVRPTPAFCGFRAGCDALTRSVYGSPLGVQLPIWGLLVFARFFALTLSPTSRLMGPLAILAGLIGLGLVAVQVFVLNQTCPFCLVIDTAAILLAAVELGLPDSTHAAPTGETPRRTPRRSAWIGTALVAMATPVAWSVLKPAPEPPTQVKSHWRTGRITVVEITDFTCPYCRESHPAMERFLDKHGERINFVRLVVPLEHRANSRPTAAAFLCGDRQGKGRPMADALFTADDHSPDALQGLAEQIGLDMQQYNSCLTDPAIDKQIDATTEWGEAANHGGLPQVWVQNVLLVNAQTPQSLNAALARVERKQSES